MTEVQTQTTDNARAMACLERHITLDAGIKAGAIPKFQGVYARRAILRDEMRLPYIIRRAEGAAMFMVQEHTDGEPWVVARHIDTGLYYAWRKDQGEPRDVSNLDRDGLGGGPFINEITAYAN